MHLPSEPKPWSGAVAQRQIPFSGTAPFAPCPRRPCSARAGARPAAPSGSHRSAPPAPSERSAARGGRCQARDHGQTGCTPGRSSSWDAAPATAPATRQLGPRGPPAASYHPHPARSPVITRGAAQQPLRRDLRLIPSSGRVCLRRRPRARSWPPLVAILPQLPPLLGIHSPQRRGAGCRGLKAKQSKAKQRRSAAFLLPLRVLPPLSEDDQPCHSPLPPPRHPHHVPSSAPWQRRRGARRSRARWRRRPRGPARRAPR